MSDFARVFRRAVRNSIYEDGAPAVLGRADDVTLYFVDKNGVTHRDRVWVRYTDSNAPMVEAVVRNGGVPPQIGAPVVVKEFRGVPTAVVNRTGLRTGQFTDGNGWFFIEPHGQTHKRLGTDPRYVEGLAFVPLSVRPSDPQALTVYVEPGWYRYGIIWDVWEGGDSGSLSSYVPASSSVTHFVVICLDRNTNTIVIVDGSDVSSGDSLFGTDVAYSDIEAITIPDDAYYPLAVVELVQGQTTVGVSDITFDLRLWGMEVSELAAQGFSADTIMTDANGDIMVDANGNVMLEST